MPSAKWMRKKLRESIPHRHTPSCKCFEMWKTHFLQGTDRDRWGQPDAAIKFYQLMLDDLHLVMRTGESSTGEMVHLQDQQRDTISKMIHCLNCRISVMRNPSENGWMTLDQLIKLKAVLKNFENWTGVFPVLLVDEPSSSKISLLSQDSGLSELYDSDENLNNNDSCLLPRLPKHTGLSRLSIQILKFGIKDQKKLVDPYLVISLRDRDSVNLTDIQSTTCSGHVRDYHAEFDNCHYEVQRYLEKIPKASAIFFELRNSEDRKTVYYATLTKEQFTTGKGFLELYKAPVDYHRKNIRRVTRNKPLYLHIEMKVLDK